MYNIWLSRKNYKAYCKAKKKTPQLEETEQASEADTAGMLELLDQGLKTSMINMLRALMDKVDSM